MVGLELDQSKGGDTGEDEVSGTLAVRKDEPPPSLSTPLCPLQGGTEAQMATSLAEGGCNSGLSVLSVADLAEELCPLHGTRTDPPPHPNPGGGRRSRRRERLERRRRWRDALARDARDGREGALASHVCAVSGKKKKLVPLGPDLCRYRCTLATCPPGKLPTERLWKGKSPPSTPPLPPMTEFPAPQSWT